MPRGRRGRSRRSSSRCSARPRRRTRSSTGPPATARSSARACRGRAGPPAGPRGRARRCSAGCRRAARRGRPRWWRRHVACVHERVRGCLHPHRVGPLDVRHPRPHAVAEHEGIAEHEGVCCHRRGVRLAHARANHGGRRGDRTRECAPSHRQDRVKADEGLQRGGHASRPAARAPVGGLVPTLFHAQACALARPRARPVMLVRMVATAVIDSAPGRRDHGGTIRATAALHRPLAPTIVRRAGLLRNLEEEAGRAHGGARRAGGLRQDDASCGSGRGATCGPSPGSTLDARHNDARRLLADVARAVDDAVGAARRTAVRARARRRRRRRAPGRRSRALRAIATDLPPQATLALGSRREPPLPLARHAGGARRRRARAERRSP